MDDVIVPAVFVKKLDEIKSSRSNPNSSSSMTSQPQAPSCESMDVSPPDLDLSEDVMVISSDEESTQQVQRKTGSNLNF